MRTGTLGLDWVEKGKLLVEALKGCISQSGHRQRLQVQQLSRRRIFLRQD